ncbi:MGH1-like glycoside hydrolase domain-containing protein [Streptomyces caniscabiei]|uniref:MGH1-like glycoside hydrolase domain-containing protein n=1 Tax=Streptomyces caniscabiei TaxID=2746961 RepID=UPI0038D42353
MFAVTQAISKIATMNADTATANEYDGKAAQLKAAVQNSLWDPQRNFLGYAPGRSTSPTRSTRRRGSI